MQMRRLPVVQDARPVADARPDPPLRGDRLLAAIEAPFLWLDRAVEAFVPPALNPLAQTGAIANVTLLVAVATGALLLFWYSASVHQAHASLEAMRGSLVPSLVRSLHRYSSDACMLFVGLHALRIVGARRFSGARWLAWITGIILVGSLWLVGWLGYWLVWDEPARQIALGSSKLLDVLPIFAEPMTRSFLTDRSIQSLLFFIVFFVHMLLPLGMAVALWLHITRLNRAAFLTRTPMTVAIMVSLVTMSLLVPAVSGQPARMLVHPGAMPIDAFYVLPVVVTDRLGGGALWALSLGATILTASVPWALSRGRAPAAQVDLAKCNGCTTCSVDCPYDAIRMVPREGSTTGETQARVDPAKCVGCGICAGSCDSSAIGLPLVSQVDARARMDRWLEGSSGAHVAFVCARSGGAALEVDAKTGLSPALPGYRVMPVPCVGWVHALTVERAIRHGARGVLLVACGSTEPPYREGGRFARERLAGKRVPKLRADHVEPDRVLTIDVNRAGRAGLIREAEAFRAGSRRERAPSRWGRAATLASLALVTSAAVVFPSRAAYSPPAPAGPELVVSFRHAGKSSEHCRDVSDAENAQKPPHMRRPRICERGRAPVRLEVVVDGAARLQRTYTAKGLHADGPSVAIETLDLAPGPHEILVRIGETHDPAEWTHEDRRTVTLGARGRVVVLFDRATSFTWEGT